MTTRSRTETAADPGTGTPSRFLAPNLVACDSWTGKDASYVQDLEARACSCPDFRYRRAEKGPFEDGRLCKHLRALLVAPETPAARPAIGHSVKTCGPTTDAEAFGGRR